MLLRLGMSNYRSVKDYAEISFIASDAIKDKGSDLLPIPASKLRALPTIVLYGANAAGKTSIYMALGAMTSHILNSFRKLEVGAPIPRTPFMLDNISREKPTRFDCDFVVDGVRYHYGFEFTNEKFEREWLYSFPEGHRRILFNRDSDNDGIDFGKHLRGKNKSIEDLMRPNSLFLSVAAQSSHEELTRVYDFFRKYTIGIGASLNDDTIQKEIGSAKDSRLVAFLKTADTGISEVDVREEEHSEHSKKIMQALRTALIAEVGEDIGPSLSEEIPAKTSVFFKHTGEDGGLYELPFAKESRGTKRLAKVMLSALKALDRGSVLFIDEIDASMHTLLSLRLISLFANKETNPNGAQLFTTTHDTNLLCSGLLRRDQIWFAEKFTDGGTHLYPLTDIKTRNTDNLERGYLQGRFGAVPYFGNVNDLFEGANHG